MQGAGALYTNQRRNYLSYFILATSQRTYWHSARICLEENHAQTFKCFDLCYSFKMLCRAEYGGTQQLHVATKNYVRNYPVGQSGGWRITY